MSKEARREVGVRECRKLGMERCKSDWRDGRTWAKEAAAAIAAKTYRDDGRRRLGDAYFG